MKFKKPPVHSLTDERINISWYTHTTEYYSAFKRKEILAQAATQTNLESLMLREIIQTRKAEYGIIPLTGGP